MADEQRQKNGAGSATRTGRRSHLHRSGIPETINLNAAAALAGPLVRDIRYAKMADIIVPCKYVSHPIRSKGLWPSAT